MAMKSRVWMKTGRYADVDMAPAWLDFYQFLKDMGPKPRPEHTLDRVDRSIGYHTGNVRWATRADQQVNRGTPKNNTTGYRGVSMKKGKFRVNICYEGGKIEKAGFDTAKEAAMAYNELATILHGDNAQLNSIPT